MFLKSFCESINRFFKKYIVLIFSKSNISLIENPKEIETLDKIEKNKVKIKFKLSKFSKENNGTATFINISIPYQFIKRFEPYRRIINHPKIRDRRLCEWDICQGEIVLSFSPEETNFIIENTIKQIENAIEWLKDNDEYPIYCTEKTITFEW